MNRALTPGDWSFILAAALLLGSTFLFIRMAITEIPPLTAAAARALIAAPVCWALMRASGVHFPRSTRQRAALVWLGLMTAAVPFAAGAWGQRYIESGLAGILFGTIPIMSVVLAPIFLAEETFSRRRMTGALAAFTGVVFLIGPSALANAGSQLLGISITLLAPLSHTLGAIYARRQSDLAPSAMATGQMIFGAAILTPIAFFTDSPLRLHLSLPSVVALLLAGVVSTAVAMNLYFVVVRRVGASRSALVPLFMPMVAVVLGAAVLDERLPFEAWLGMALILAGGRAVSFTQCPGASSPPVPVQTAKESPT